MCYGPMQSGRGRLVSSETGTQAKLDHVPSIMPINGILLLLCGRYPHCLLYSASSSCIDLFQNTHNHCRRMDYKERQCRSSQRSPIHSKRMQPERGGQESSILKEDFCFRKKPWAIYGCKFRERGTTRTDAATGRQQPPSLQLPLLYTIKRLVETEHILISPLCAQLHGLSTSPRVS